MKPEKFQNLYRIPSARAPWWDYGQNGAYFITICTKNRQYFFGAINDGIMYHYEAGELAIKFWEEIPKRFPYISLDAFVVMPDHIHGILVIEKTDESVCRDAIHRVYNHQDTMNRVYNHQDTMNRVYNHQDAMNRVSTENPGGITGHHNPMLNQNLSRVIRWLKGRTTYESRKVLPEFGWQARFYDRIIRNPDEWERIRRYIHENPNNWKL